MSNDKGALDSDTMVGYHGTKRDAAENIIITNFQLIEDPDYWLGKGAYFFADAAAGKDNALYWAKVYKKYTQWAIIKARISNQNQLNIVANTEHRISVKKIRNMLFRNHVRAGGKAEEFNENMVFLHIDKTDSFWSYVASINPASKPTNVVYDLQIQVCVKDLRAILSREIVQEGIS